MRCGSLFDPVIRGEAEFLEILETFDIPGDGEVGKSALGLRIERIVSEGHVSPEGFWYDQDEPEWVGPSEFLGTTCYADLQKGK